MIHFGPMENVELFVLDLGEMLIDSFWSYDRCRVIHYGPMENVE